MVDEVILIRLSMSNFEREREQDKLPSGLFIVKERGIECIVQANEVILVV